MMFELKNLFCKSLFIWILALFPNFVSGQIAGCSLAIPPFISSGVGVNHELGDNVEIWFNHPEWYICGDSNLFIPTNTPTLVLGEMNVYDPIIWNPFSYKLFFSQPINSLKFLLYVGNGENLIFETEQANINLANVYACDELIFGDTILLGFNSGTGDGIFTISFDCPVYSFSISGNGEGGGVGFQICQNSLTTPNLWGRISGDSLISSSQDSIVFNAFGGVAPYTFSYTVNGGAVQTLVSNTPQLSLPLPVSNGTYTYNLLQVQDGNDSVAVIGCNSEFVAVVNFVHTAELEALSFSLSPNPAKGELYISESLNLADNTAVQLTDMEGRIVLETKYKQGEALDISGLKSGLYFLRIESEKGWVAKRFVKL